MGWIQSRTGFRLLSILPNRIPIYNKNTAKPDGIASEINEARPLLPVAGITRYHNRVWICGSAYFEESTLMLCSRCVLHSLVIVGLAKLCQAEEYWNIMISQGTDSDSARLPVVIKNTRTRLGIRFPIYQRRIMDDNPRCSKRRLYLF